MYCQNNSDQQHLALAKKFRVVASHIYAGVPPKDSGTGNCSGFKIDVIAGVAQLVEQRIRNVFPPLSVTP